LGEEHRLRVFENSVLRRIFGPKREEDGSWRKLHNDELHSPYSSPNIVREIISRRMRWAGHVARIGEGRGVYRVLVGRPEGKSPLGRPRRRWKYNIKLELWENGIDRANWIQLAQDRVQWRVLVNTVMNLRVPYR
jgi:transcription termination factor 2